MKFTVCTRFLPRLAPGQTKWSHYNCGERQGTASAGSRRAIIANLPIVWLEMYIASMDRQFYLPET
jgi:hypothetical protein